MSFEQHQGLEGYGPGFVDGRNHNAEAIGRAFRSGIWLGACYGIFVGVIVAGMTMVLVGGLQWK